MLTLEQVKKDPEVINMLSLAEKHLDANGFTEHSIRHVSLVSKTASYILRTLEYSEEEIVLAEISGYLHDIGNAVNRMDHAHSGAILAYGIVKRLGMNYLEAGEIMLAIANHDEHSGVPVSNISAAIILADKSDVHRSRVRNKERSAFDIHDRVNYAVVESSIQINVEDCTAILNLHIDTEICPVMDYFEIFLVRMTMTKKAASYLGLKFQLIINDNRLL